MRSVPEWVGKTDDEPIPPRVRLRVVARANHCCQAPGCGIRIRYGAEIDHIVALANWNSTPEAPHGNRENNLQLLCKNHHGAKSKCDVAEKSKIAKTQIRMGPLKRERKGFWCWRKFDGSIVYRSSRE